MAAQYAVRATMLSTLKYTPGELAFHRDMIQPFPSKIDWKQIVETKQINVNKENVKENSTRTEFDYKVRQKVLILNKNQFKSKLEPTVLNEGTWTIQQVCHGSSSDTTANKINPYYLIGEIFIYIHFFILIFQ